MLTRYSSLLVSYYCGVHNKEGIRINVLFQARKRHVKA